MTKPAFPSPSSAINGIFSNTGKNEHNDILGILCEVAGTTGMRAFVYSNPALSQTSATVGIVISYFLVSRAVEKIPMSIAYAIWSGLGTGGVSLLSWFFFREAMPPLKILGLCLVIVGMLFINLDKSAQEKAK